MPRANPNASFKAAAKHLVRHLHEPNALAGNPLTSAFFENDRQAALARIHDLFRAGAEHCRDNELAGGSAERARRQYAIAIEECLLRRRPSSLAVTLGISAAQYYRERTDVCTKICRYIRDRVSHGSKMLVERFDDRRFGIERAARLAEIGETERAIREFERLLHEASTVAQKVEALCELALTRLRSGAFETTDRDLREAETLVSQFADAPVNERVASHARTSFVRGMYTWPRDPSSALALFKSALDELERFSGEWPDGVRTLYVRILFEFGEALTTFSNTRGSVETLARAAKILARCPSPPPVMALKIETTILALRMSMLVDPLGWETVDRRLDKAQELARRAIATGSVDLNLAALNVLSQLQARAGDAASAFESIRSAMRLSRYQPSREIFSEVSLRMARTLLYTPLWQETPNVLKVAGAPATVAVAASRKTLMAEYAFHKRAYAKITGMFSRAEIERRPYAGVLVAGAAHALGDRSRARALIERSLPAVEKGGVAVTIGQTYEIAGQVMSDRRYARKAGEIRHGLTV